ncbi:helix-turn-helix domain-containing protein [Robertmurraya siralis]|uniref:helix-turn-helix domain-containing protein n=1 Tax=Robertmurraya siralis TaxID=77777 RepID=UPI0010F75DB9|nr:helix-turn-helix transcriptional regulator [Robertmurraya siralis]
MLHPYVGKCLLQNILDEKRMSLNDLADKTGISKHQLSAYKNQKKLMSLPTSRLIASKLDCHIDDLYKWNI